MFELLSEWETQWETMKELDQRANDPERYHNRGGQLLMEEKQRKATEKVYFLFLLFNSVIYYWPYFKLSNYYPIINIYLFYKPLLNNLYSFFVCQ